MPLIPDKEEKINGLKVYEYNLLRHNDNKIALPMVPRKKTVAITIHNTEWIQVASNTTPAEQYVRATYLNRMGDCRVNYYVDKECAWRCLPDDWVNWSCADGCANPNSGNNTSIAIEIIGDSKEAEANGIKLAAALMKKYGLSTTEGLCTHSYWMNIMDGAKGTIQEINTMKNKRKNCPIYILPHWEQFVKQVAAALGEEEEKEQPKVEPVKTENPKPQFTKKKIDVFYKVFANNRWNSEIKNFEDKTSMGYAGLDGWQISGVAARLSEGQLAYRVHLKNGGWLNWIMKCNTNDWLKGCAGLKSQPIDGIQFELIGLPEYKIRYRVSTTKTKTYLPWVEGTSDYAGIFGQLIDKIQVEVI